MSENRYVVDDGVLENIYLGGDSTVVHGATPQQELLKQNQKAVLAVGGQVAINTPKDVDVTGLRSTINSALADRDYSTAIRTLNELRDARNGIAWTRDERSHTIVRDARNVTPPVETDGPEAYAMQYLNVTRGAITLIEQAAARNDLSRSDAIRAIQQLEKSAVAFCHNIDGVEGAKELGKAIKQGNSHIVDVVSGALGIKESDAKKRLNTAKDFSNFQDTHYHTVTLATVEHAGQEYTTFEADVALLGLTDSQQAEYAQINGQTGPDWYQAMPAWERDLVQGAKAAITDGQHVIPTQLRSNTVGIRNAYNKVSGVLNNGDMEVAHEMLHSGTVASESRADKQRVADMNVAQQEAFAGGPVHCVTLNTPVNPTGNDKSIVSQTASATEANGASHSNLAFNSLRRLNPNKYDGINKALGEIASAVQADVPALADYLNGNGSKSKAEAAIKGLATDGETKRVLNYVVEINDLMHNNGSPLDPENRNLRIGTCLSMVVDAVNNGRVDSTVVDYKQKLDPLVTMCQSGKDRDGLLLFSSATEAIGNKISEISGSEVNRDGVRQAHAQAGHTQQMAGGDGGSKGCFGIKKDTLGAIPEQWNDIAGTLSQATGSFNKFKTEEKPGLFDRFVTWVKELLGIEDKSKDAPSIVDPRAHGQQKGVTAPEQTVAISQEVDGVAPQAQQQWKHGIPEGAVLELDGVEVPSQQNVLEMDDGSQIPLREERRTREGSVFRPIVEGLSEADKENFRGTLQQGTKSLDRADASAALDTGTQNKAHDAAISDAARLASKEQGV